MKTFFQFLREYNRAITLQQKGDQLKRGAALDRNQTPDQVLTTLEEIDPTPNKQYVAWLIREYGEQRFRLEDKLRLNTLLNNFDQVKSRLPQKDINRYKVHELENAINAIFNATLGQAQTNAPFVIPDDNKDDVEILYNGPLGLLTIPKTEAASCELGRGTKWCTAAQKNNRFDDYNDKDPLYIWRDKNGEKYQFHFDSSEFMDARDKPITTETLNQFRTEHPILKKLFQREEAKNGTDPKWAYRYAHDAIKGRWPEGEAVIAKDPKWAYFYAINVIKGRFPEGEAAIAKGPQWVFFYAIDVIKGRWPEGEAAIAKDPKWAYRYAHDVIEGRWPEAEAVIATDPEWAYFYAFNVIKGRWPEGEAAIAKGDYKQRYREFLAGL